jgi:recombination protein RecT
MASKELTVLSNNVNKLLTTNKKQLLMALPKHLSADKMIRIVLSEILRNKDLLGCDIPSICKCVLIAAQIGLLIDSTTGESYLIPFKNNKTGKKEAQLIIGYQGLLKLVYQSGQVTNIMPREVYENDTFKYKYGLNPDLIHEPCKGDRGKIIAYYVVAQLVNGGSVFEVMSLKDIDDHMNNYSPSCKKPSSPWQTNKPAMAKKTLVRKIVKYLPKSSENLMRAVSVDEKAEIGIQGEATQDIIIDGEIIPDEPIQTEPTTTKADQMAQKLENKQEPSPFQDHINKISLSESRPELQAAYDIAIDKAKDAKDNAAMTELKKAYETKLDELQKGDANG